MQLKKDIYKLCVDCFKCKTKNGDVYCKLGVWKEKNDGKSILYTPYDFNCPEFEDV